VSEKYDLIIIGGGPGGVAAAEVAAAKKKRVLIIEKTAGAAPARTEAVFRPRRYWRAASILPI